MGGLVLQNTPIIPYARPPVSINLATKDDHKIAI